MIITNNVLCAEPGRLLTNGDVYSDTVYLSYLDSIDNWTEIPITEIPEETLIELGFPPGN